MLHEHQIKTEQDGWKVNDYEQDGGETECEHDMDVRCNDEQTDMKWTTNNHTNKQLVQEIRLVETK